MGRLRPTSFGFAGLLCFFLATGAARASGPVRLRFATASTCGSAAELATRLASRGVALSETGIPLEVVAIRGADGAESTFELTGKEGRAARTLAAESCDAVLDAVAFAVEVALANDLPPTLPTPPSTPPSPSTPSTPPSPPARTPPPARAPPLAPLPADFPSLARGGQWAIAVSGGVGLVAGTSPSVAPRLTFHAEIERIMGPVLAPSLRLGAAFALPTTALRDGVQVAFATQSGFLSFCPVRFVDAGEQLTLRPCVRGEAGRLEAKADAVRGAKLTQNSLVAVGAEVRGRARIGGPLFVEAVIDAVVPLRRSAFFVGDASAYELAPVRFGVTLGVGLRFP